MSTALLVFLSGLFGSSSSSLSSALCMGKVINGALIKRDGPPDKWHEKLACKTRASCENLASNPEMQQQDSQMTKTFPEPRVLI